MSKENTTQQVRRGQIYKPFATVHKKDEGFAVVLTDKVPPYKEWYLCGTYNEEKEAIEASAEAERNPKLHTKEENITLIR